MASRRGANAEVVAKTGRIADLISWALIAALWTGAAVFNGLHHGIDAKFGAPWRVIVPAGIAVICWGKLVFDILKRRGAAKS